MTDIEMLPLPEADHVGGNDVFGKEFPLFTTEQAEAYARAIAEHNVAARDAEIERLRAEVEVLRASSFANATVHIGIERDQLKARAERLAKALRMMGALLDEVRSCFTRDDDLPDNLLPRIDAALRDHDQEGKDG